MKVQCDVCAAEAASVFCCADEAALCDGCDHRVHRANKVAGKHRRFSLLHPNSSALWPPLCDICQEKRGLLFCKEDRAILCRDCDGTVHSASDLAVWHNRFLLTGVRISNAALAAPSLEEAAVVEIKLSGARSINMTTDSSASTATMVSSENGHGHSIYNSSSSSSISEYLINVLPGWHVEDFLTDDTSTNDISTAGSGLCEVDDAAQFAGVDRVRGGTERSCWMSSAGGVGLREVKRVRGKQQRQRRYADHGCAAAGQR